MLGRGWESGEATIVETRSVPRHVQDAGGLYYDAKRLVFVLDVHPTGLAPGFRADTEALMPEGLEHLQEGDIVPVKFDTKSQEVRFDRAGRIFLSHKPLATLGHEGNEQTHEPDRTPAPGATSAGTPDVVMQSGNVGDPVRAELRVSTDPAKIEQMKERLRQIAAQSPGSMTSFSVRGPTAGGPDDVEQLAKLAELHDRGVLTDAEFAAQKAKILGSE